MAKDYYNILGISKSASADEIKRAYRKLAHQYHPDKNSGNDTKFKEINEAYQVLSNPQKKAQYDQFGTVGGPGGFEGFGGFGQGAQDFDFRNFGGFQTRGFSFNFGGMGDIFEDLFGGMMSQVQTQVEIPLTSALLGEKIQLRTTNGDTIDLNIPSGTQDGTTFRFKGKGNQMRNGRRGDLLITVKVKIPRHLSREQKRLLEELKNLGL
jgi:curved DNA-binding protein